MDRARSDRSPHRPGVPDWTLRVVAVSGALLAAAGVAWLVLWLLLLVPLVTVAVSLALLLAELLSLWLSLSVLLHGRFAGRRRWSPLLWAAATLALDAFALWLCLIYAPARFDTDLPVIIRQFPDVGVSLVMVLALAVIWPIPRTLWLLLTVPGRPAGGQRAGGRAAGWRAGSRRATATVS